MFLASVYASVGLFLCINRSRSANASVLLRAADMPEDLRAADMPEDLLIIMHSRSTNSFVGFAWDLKIRSSPHIMPSTKHRASTKAFCQEVACFK